MIKVYLLNARDYWTMSTKYKNNMGMIIVSTIFLDCLVPKPKEFQKCLRKTIEEIKAIPGV